MSSQLHFSRNVRGFLFCAGTVLLAVASMLSVTLATSEQTWVHAPILYVPLFWLFLVAAVLSSGVALCCLFSAPWQLAISGVIYLTGLIEVYSILCTVLSGVNPCSVYTIVYQAFGLPTKFGNILTHGLFIALFAGALLTLFAPTAQKQSLR